MKRIELLLVGCCILLMQACGTVDSWQFESTDGNVSFLLENKKSDADTYLCYTLFYKGKKVVGESALGLLMDGQEYGKNAAFVSAKPFREITEAYTLKSGKRREAVNNYREQVFTFRTPDKLYSS